jgi:hypothetical protein
VHTSVRAAARALLDRWADEPSSAPADLSEDLAELADLADLSGGGGAASGGGGGGGARARLQERARLQAVEELPGPIADDGDYRLLSVTRDPFRWLVSSYVYYGLKGREYGQGEDWQHGDLAARGGGAESGSRAPPGR